MKGPYLLSLGILKPRAKWIAQGHAEGHLCDGLTKSNVLLVVPCMIAPGSRQAGRSGVCL